jgi:hypothetical protein
MCEFGCVVFDFWRTNAGGESAGTRVWPTLQHIKKAAPRCSVFPAISPPERRARLNGTPRVFPLRSRSCLRARAMASAPAVAATVTTSRVFPSATSRRSRISPNAPAFSRHQSTRALIAARVASAHPPASAPASDDGDADGRSSGEPILFRFGDDDAANAVETSLTDTRETRDHADDAGGESAMEVLRGPGGSLLFRFTGDAQAEFEAVSAMAADSGTAVPALVEPLTPTQKAQALLDEAAGLIEKAKAITTADESDTDTQLAAAAKATDETLAAPDLDGTEIIKRGTAANVAKNQNQNASAIARVSQLGVKAVVDGIESMFSNFRKTPIARKVEQVTNPVRLPKAPKDSPWGSGGGPIGAGMNTLDAAFDSFGIPSNGSDGDDYDGLLLVTETDDPEVALAEKREREHQDWEASAAKALEQGSLASLETQIDPEPELAVERYGNVGDVVAGLWRPKPIPVSIAGRSFVAYITPSNLKQLPSGEYVVGTTGDGDESTKVPGDNVGDETTIILAEEQSDGSNVFFFGLTRTVLADGSVLYKFPSGETLG